MTSDEKLIDALKVAEEQMLANKVSGSSIVELASKRLTELLGVEEELLSVLSWVKRYADHEKDTGPPWDAVDRVIEKHSQARVG